MTDWKSDPEMKALRDEFIASFAERRKLLAPVLSSLRPDHDSREQLLSQLQYISHKLGGAAAPFGFPLLSQIGGALDDLLDVVRESKDVPELREYAALLDEALAAAASGEDPIRLAEDPRLLRLTDAVSRLPAEATNESS